MVQTELGYLLNELENWDDDAPIQVKDLKRMIVESFNKMAKDIQDIDSSMSEIGHDMP
jgi:hypothetical protein